MSERDGRATHQANLDLFREMNRYDDRHADYPSDVVFEHPRRTLNQYWRKYHAVRDCGRGKVAYVENSSSRPVGDKWAYTLRCWECGHRVDEDEVLFIGGDWFSKRGAAEFGRSLEDLFMPPERVLDLGPDPSRNELVHALNLTRIEREASPGPTPGAIREDDWRECEDCGHAVPMLFDGYCRMCYDGEWTDRLQRNLDAFETKLREWHNNSFVHRLEKNVDPTTIGDRCHTGKILWRRHNEEPAPKLVEVTQCLQDADDDHWEYVLEDPTRTERVQYRQEDLVDCFWDTGLNNRDHLKAVQDDRIREVWNRVKGR